MTDKTGKFIDVAELGRAMKRKRTESGLSLRDVADLTKVSASTLSRIENGTGRPDADNIAALTQWLNMPVDRLLSGERAEGERAPVVYYGSEATPEIVAAHLRADPNLDPATAAALCELFRVAYNQMSSPGRKEDSAEGAGDGADKA
jgi:transcriptional regulator with XRE-family HTH domain